MLHIDEENCYSVSAWDKWDGHSIDPETESYFRFDFLTIDGRFVPVWETGSGDVGRLNDNLYDLRSFDTLEAALATVAMEIIHWMRMLGPKFVAIYAHGAVDDFLRKTGAARLIGSLAAECTTHWIE